MLLDHRGVDPRLSSQTACVAQRVEVDHRDLWLTDLVRRKRARCRRHAWPDASPDQQDLAPFRRVPAVLNWLLIEVPGVDGDQGTTTEREE